MGQGQHMANPHRPGRTFGSVWRAMCSLVENEPDYGLGKATLTKAIFFSKLNRPGF